MYTSSSSLRTCVDLTGGVSDGVSDDLNAKPVIAGHAVGPDVGRVALTDVHRRGSTSVALAGDRRPADDDDADDGQLQRQVAAATTSPRQGDALSHHDLVSLSCRELIVPRENSSRRRDRPLRELASSLESW